MARGDITANEVYADREMLNRLGYGIFDVMWGSSGIGSENIRDFSYLVAQDKDPRLYRRKVYELINRYYRNDLAKAIWNKFIEHKWVMSERAGQEVDLRTAAQDWFKEHSHAFLKEWTFQQKEVPERIRNNREPQKSYVGMVASTLVPDLRELLQAGFSVTDIAWAALAKGVKLGAWREAAQPKKPRRRLLPFSKNSVEVLREKKPHERGGSRADDQWQDENKYLVLKKAAPEDIVEGRYYVRMVANLTGHEPKDKEEAERRWREILEHKWYMSERAGHDVGLPAAALDYFRRLNLLREAETGHES